MKTAILILLAVSLLSLTACVDNSPSADNNSSGNDNSYIENKGSDTIVNLALAWAEAYQELRPNISVSVTGGGSGTGISALINGTTDVANASRQIKPEEIESIQESGSDPVEFIIARDAIAILVHRDNPIDSLTLQQISDIYSGNINDWSEIGGEKRPIVRLSRETNSGTHVYFLEQVLRLGDKSNQTLFSQDTLLLPSSEVISAEIRDNPNAIGYDGLGYVTEDMKVVAVAKDNDLKPVLPSIETVNNNTYPISRDLYMYTAGEPPKIIREYLDWIRSPEAQLIVIELGFVPLEK
ncbi:MAG: phosphate ABC transporter substrate-binding protein [Anaerolineales bacterium]|nr:phosphate ABC transporter substrate-binding protein [Anaerolineales bacterium]